MYMYIVQHNLYVDVEIGGAKKKMELFYVEMKIEKTAFNPICYLVVAFKRKEAGRRKDRQKSQVLLFLYILRVLHACSAVTKPSLLQNHHQNRYN